jgi:cytochrome c oxidase assembly factor CtaG
MRLALRPIIFLAALFAPRAHAHAQAPKHDWLTLDPWTLAMLLVVILVYVYGVHHLWRRGLGQGVRLWQVGAYAGGLGALVLALVWPLEALSAPSLSAHMAQHMLLVAIAPPLLVVGLPLRALGASVPGRGVLRVLRSRPGRAFARPLPAFVLHSAVLWAWHVPALYQAALRHAGVHGLEHASFFASALLLWWALLTAGRARADGYGVSALLTLAMVMHTGLLGALLTFAARPLYPIYDNAARFGLTPLEDQQLAGLIMWVPGGLIYLCLGLLLAQAWLREAERRDALVIASLDRRK